MESMGGTKKSFLLLPNKYGGFNCDLESDIPALSSAPVFSAFPRFRLAFHAMAMAES
jgi:hypothetical protein